jgi:hypothetical protein
MGVPSCCRGLNAADLRRVWTTPPWSTSSHEAGGGSGLRLTASIGRLIQAQPDSSRQAQWHGSKETARIPDAGRCVHARPRYRQIETLGLLATFGRVPIWVIGTMVVPQDRRKLGAPGGNRTHATNHRDRGRGGTGRGTPSRVDRECRASAFHQGLVGERRFPPPEITSSRARSARCGGPCPGACSRFDLKAERTVIRPRRSALRDVAPEPSARPLVTPVPGDPPPRVDAAARARRPRRRRSGAGDPASAGATRPSRQRAS